MDGEKNFLLTHSQLVSVLNGMVDAIWVFNSAGDPLYLNQNALSFIGLSSLSEFFPKYGSRQKLASLYRDFNLRDESGAQVLDLDNRLSRALAGEESPPFILRVRKGPNSPERMFLNRMRRLANPHGEPELLVAIIHDITAVRAKTQALRDRERELSLIYDHVTDLVGLLRVSAPGEYRILTANSAYFRLSPKTPQEVIGKRLEEFLTPEGFAIWDGKLREIIEHKKAIRFESETYTMNAPFHLDQNWMPVLDDKEEVTHVLVTARDITELKATQERLRQSEKMEAIGQLAGGVAHDFNNLLTAINGFADLSLVRSDLPAEVREYLESIRRSGDKAAALTSQLLAYSRKTMMVPRQLNLNASVTDMEKILRRLINEDITISTRLKPDLGDVRADPGQISQVILNLAVNARDAMPAGGKLTLETSNVSLPAAQAYSPVDAKPGPYVRLSVRDSGTGMSESVRARIFEPFFTTKEAGQGTGLGLSSVYGIVRQSGGYITVQSTVGKGSTFHLLLPRVDSHEMGSSAPAAESAPLGRENVLLVEDEEPVRIFLAKALESFGYTVRKCRNGSEALNALRENPLSSQLVITDLVMPGMSGSALSKTARQLNPLVKVLFISGYADHSLAKEALSLAGAYFLQKPFSSAQLAMRVRQALDQ